MESVVPRSVAPDVFVVIGAVKRMRNSYVLWQEPKGPDFVMEIVSESTWRRDRDEKPGLYASLGVGECFLFDATGEHLARRLSGYRLEDGVYRPLAEEVLGNGRRGLRSGALGLCVYVDEGDELRWRDPVSGKDYLTLEETERARRAEAAARGLAERGRKAETAARRAAEARIADLQARLARLSRGPGGGEDR